MLDRLCDFAREHSLFLPGQRIGLAVSGGADSIFLLHALRQLAPRWNLHLSVVHIDHGIRGAESHQDAEFVRSLAAEYGLPFHLEKANLPAGNLEQEARRARQNFFTQLIQAGRADRVATGHTRSDQAETVLFRILRGSGLTGLAGVLPCTKEGLVRPLLPCARSEIRDWLRQHGYTWREDSSNLDIGFQRNKLRNETLPQLEADFNPRLEDALAQLATLARDEEIYWNQVLPRLDPGPVVILKTGDVSAQPAFGRRLLRHVIAHVKGDLRQIEFAHVERLLQMARQAEDGHDRAILPGVDAIRSFELLRIVPLGYDKGRIRDYSYPLDPAELQDSEMVVGELKLRLSKVSGPLQPCATVKEKLDWQRLVTTSNPQSSPRGLELRNWRPGDQYRRIGRAHPEKIKEMFQQLRVPLWERHEWPVLTADKIVVWAKGFGAASEFVARPDSALVLSIWESKESE